MNSFLNVKIFFHKLFDRLVKWLKFAVVLSVLITVACQVRFHICLEVDFGYVIFLKIKKNKIKAKRYS